MKEKQDYNNTRMGDYIQNEGLHLKGGGGASSKSLQSSAQDFA